ncbi:ribonuclease P protein subunit p30 [Periplaneta americana]|uniref:ribonuclease P protein subunit p30 n=1 Tax=Periplaneta americana TaxID=6978 RepID=UPI0037E8E556
MISVRGFCDLNVCIDGENKKSLRNTCQTLLDLGYRVIALNHVFDASVLEQKKKKKKGEVQEKSDPIPAPSNEDIVQHFKGKLDINQRLTVVISSHMEAHKLSQSANAKLYNILAVIPNSQAAFQHACSTMEVDLITFDPNNIGVVKYNRKMYNMAVGRGISFELMYAPAIRDSTARKNIIQLAHSYHAYGKSKQIVVSSGASNPFHIRGPYDIVNLGLLFGLSEEQSKAALTSACRFLLIRAAGRRLGKTVVIPSSNNNIYKEPEESDMITEEMELDCEQPAHKKLRQDVSDSVTSLVDNT